MTTRVQLSGAPDLVAECDPRRDAAAADLLRAIARRHAAGPSLHPGSIVDVGWAPLQVREGDAGEWQLCEPLYGAEPVDWRRGLDLTLAVLDSQATLVRALGVQPLATRCDQWLLVGPGVLQARSVLLERKPPVQEGDSGWFAAVNDPAIPADRRLAERATAGTLLMRKPAWTQVLALPVGYMALFERDRLDGILDEADREVYHPPEDAQDG